MTAMSPGEASKKLGISTSTLRKYSLLMEKEQITFERTQNNSRQYTDTQVVALQEVITSTKDGDETLENAIKAASNKLKGASVVAEEVAVTTEVSQRYDVDVAAVISEIKSLKEEIQAQKEVIDGFRIAQEKRDSYFVEILEQLQGKIDTLNEQKALPIIEEDSQQKEKSQKKGFFNRFFNKSLD